MEWTRIATLIGIALLVAAPFVAHIRVALLVNSLAVFAAAMWLLADKKKDGIGLG